MASSFPGGERGSVPPVLLEQISVAKTGELPKEAVVFIDPNTEVQNSGALYYIKQGETYRTIRYDAVFTPSLDDQEDSMLRPD